MVDSRRGGGQIGQMFQNALNQREFSVHNEMQWPIFRKSRAPRQNSWVFPRWGPGSVLILMVPICHIRHFHKFRGSSSTQSQKPWSCWEKAVAAPIRPFHGGFLDCRFCAFAGLPLYASWAERVFASDWTGYWTWERKTKIMNWSDIQTSLNRKTKQPTLCASGEVQCQARGCFYINIYRPMIDWWKWCFQWVWNIL